MYGLLSTLCLIVDRFSLEVVRRARDLSLSDPKDRNHLLSVPVVTGHHIPHTGNDHDKTHPIYKIGISLGWPWSGSGALT
jgi:hypothetical protein